MPGQVHFAKKDGVATLTLDNPKARNAFDYEMTQELRRRWAEILRDPEIVCAIVTGAGEKAFCSGWDITSTASGESHKFSQAGRKNAPYSQITALQCRCWKPVITAVNGMCSGGGLHFVADGDIVIASETATFFDTHCEVGLPAALEPAGLARVARYEAIDAEDAAALVGVHPVDAGLAAGDHHVDDLLALARPAGDGRRRAELHVVGVRDDRDGLRPLLGQGLQGLGIHGTSMAQNVWPDDRGSGRLPR